MDDAATAKRSWESSAEAWVEIVERDKNRTQLLDPIMLEFAGVVSGRDVIDIGCGEGRFCRMLGARGARTVGIDPVEHLIETARERDLDGEYRLGGAELLPFANASFDLAVSYIVLVDVAEFRGAILEMARVLRPGGRAIVANLNSFTTSTNIGWIRDESGVKLHFPVDNYFEERADRVEWGGMSILNWHRPMEAYMSAFLDAGLILRRFVEPKPTREVIDANPKMADSLRVPWFHAMVWEKP